MSHRKNKGFQIFYTTGHFSMVISTLALQYAVNIAQD